MADLPEADEFPAAITQIETTEPVSGGVAGIANRGLIQLAKRTRWLKNRIDESIATLFDPAGDYPDLRARSTTAADVGLGNILNLPIQHDPAAGVSTEYLSGAGGRALYDMLGGIPAMPGDFARHRLEVLMGEDPPMAWAGNQAGALGYPAYTATPITGTANDGANYGYVVVNGAQVQSGSFSIPAGWYLRIESWEGLNPP